MNIFPSIDSNFVMQSITESPRHRSKVFTIRRAAHLGMCFGVRDAIALAHAEASRQPLTILGELVHNESVIAELQAKGIGIEDEPAKVKTEAVMITAHGASQAARRRAETQGLRVLEATCPLVHYAHRAVLRLVQNGFHPVILGKRGHIEVRGLTEDLPEFDIVLTAEDLECLRERPRFGVAAQTTQPLAKVRQMVEAMREKFPHSEIRFIDTVCQPTKQRQDAAVELARQSDVIVVIGGATSNNTRELVATCATYCARVHHIQTAANLMAEWFTNADSVGITAGTSTPDWVVDEVEKQIHECALSLMRI